MYFPPATSRAARAVEEILLSDPGIGTYKRLVIKDNRLAGAVLVSDTSDGAWYLELIRSARPIGKIRDSLAFGRALRCLKSHRAAHVSRLQSGAEALSRRLSSPRQSLRDSASGRG